MPKGVAVVGSSIPFLPPISLPVTRFPNDL